MNNGQISIELSGLIALQTEYFNKSNPVEVEEFQRAGECIRRLFAELERAKAA